VSRRASWCVSYTSLGYAWRSNKPLCLLTSPPSVLTCSPGSCLTPGSFFTPVPPKVGLSFRLPRLGVDILRIGRPWDLTRGSSQQLGQGAATDAGDDQRCVAQS